jgi:hypothetical protein
VSNLAQTAPVGDRPFNTFAETQRQLTAHAPASPSLQPQNAIAPQAPALLLP